MDSVLSIMIRSIVIYIFIIVAIRLFGKKELAQLSVVDLVFILLISNSVQNAMVGDNSTLTGGIVAATALFLVNYLFKNLFYRSKKISEFFQGDPLMLIYHGTIIEENLKKAQISQAELEAAVREHGVEHIREVDLAIFEVDGNISVLSENFRRRSIRKRRAHKVISKSE